MSKTGELFGTFFKIGAFTFGGGYAMVALLEHEFVEEKFTASTEQPTMAASTTATTAVLKGVRCRFLSILTPADRIR